MQALREDQLLAVFICHNFRFISANSRPFIPEEYKPLLIPWVWALLTGSCDLFSSSVAYASAEVHVSVDSRDIVTPHVETAFSAILEGSEEILVIDYGGTDVVGLRVHYMFAIVF